MNSNKLHEKIRELYEKGLFGPMLGIKCTVQYESLCERSDLEHDVPVSKMAEKLSSLLLDGHHPTINPINDHLVEMETNNYEEAICKFIKENYQFEQDRLDNTQDYLKISLELVLVLGNVLPFLDQNDIKITKAKILTGPFEYEVQE